MYNAIADIEFSKERQLLNTKSDSRKMKHKCTMEERAVEERRRIMLEGKKWGSFNEVAI
jgi:hypothetical protein